MSQLDLALEAGVSARYLSFVETGRARPSAEMVLHLADVEVMASELSIESFFPADRHTADAVWAAARHRPLTGGRPMRSVAGPHADR